MVDRAVVATKLRQIEQYHGELQEKQTLSRETFLADVTQRRAVERMFENTIQACIDLAKHIARTAFDYHGDRSREAVEILAENDIIEATTAEVMVDAVGFRNILAHEYGNVKSEQVYQYLQTELELYEQFSQQVASWVEENQ